MEQPYSIRFTENQIQEVAAALIIQFPNHTVFLVEGEMGAGKTTLIKAICSYLGAENSLSSPTYSIVNEYSTAEGNSIYHFDLYRINKPNELISLGFDEYLESKNYCFVEWPDVGANFYETAVRVNIQVGADNLREITAKSMKFY